MFLFLIILLSSCSQHFYAPTGSNLPNIQEQGSIGLQGGIGLANPSLSGTGSLTIAPFKSVALTATGFFGKPMRYDIATNIGSQKHQGAGQYGELGIGLYSNKLRSFRFRQGVSILVFGGAGQGSFSSEMLQNLDVTDKASMQFDKVWLQTAAFIHNPFFDVGFSLKAGIVQFNQGTFVGDEFRFENAFNFYNKQDRFLVIEPTLQLRLGRSDRFQVLLYATATSMPEDISTNTILGAGFQCQLKRLFKK